MASSAALAGEKTVTPTVENMDCSACPITVKSSLEAVRGVTKAVVSYAGQNRGRNFRRRQDHSPGADRRNHQCGLSLRTQELIPS
jgi:copper chaperone CopZ